MSFPWTAASSLSCPIQFNVLYRHDWNKSSQTTCIQLSPTETIEISTCPIIVHGAVHLAPILSLCHSVSLRPSQIAPCFLLSALGNTYKRDWWSCFYQSAIAAH